MGYRPENQSLEEPLNVLIKAMDEGLPNNRDTKRDQD